MMAFPSTVNRLQVPTRVTGGVCEKMPKMYPDPLLDKINALLLLYKK
jgi:hypothetical protein